MIAASKKRVTFWLCCYRCYYCGRKPKGEPLTIDHKLPKCRRGTNALENLVAACNSCNGEKANGTVDEYRKQLRKTKGYGFKFVGETDVEIASRQSYSLTNVGAWLDQLTPLGATEEDTYEL